MNRRVAWCSLVLSALVVVDAHAQAPTTVQLPTFSTFSSRSSVLVPDRGSAYLGGISRAASGRNEFGVPMLPFRPFRNRAIGKELSSSNLRVTATIHDFEAMDELLLGGGPVPSGRQPMLMQSSVLPRTFAPRANAAIPSGHIDPRIGSSWKPATPKPEVSAEERIAQIQAESRGRRTAAAAEATDLFDRGRKAEDAGKLNVAKIYYRMAAKKGDDSLRSRVGTRLAAIAQKETGPKVAHTTP